MRLQLELLKPEMFLNEHGIDSTVVSFGSARIPDPMHKAKARTKRLAELTAHYDEARIFAHKMTEMSMKNGGRDFAIVTGGGPGATEAGNLGAAEAGGKSIGLGIVLPHEQAPNPYVTLELSFKFHYFATRKMHFPMGARTICIFPGGFGTMDEIFEALTPIQTGRIERIPFLIFGKALWEKVIDWQSSIHSYTIAREDIDLFQFVATANEAVHPISAWVLASKREAIPICD